MLNQMDAGALAQWRSHASAQTNGEGGAAYVNGECVCVWKTHTVSKAQLTQLKKYWARLKKRHTTRTMLQRHYLWLFISLSFSFLFFVPGSELNATFTSKSEFH